MKNIFLLFCILPTFIIASNFCFQEGGFNPYKKPHIGVAEDEKHHLHKRAFLTLSTGANLWGAIVSEYFSESDFNFDYKQRTMPLVLATADYGVSRKFSIGLSLGYQQTKINYKEKYYISPSDYITNSYEFSAKRILLTVKGDYYIFNKKKNFLLFVGFRAGENFMNYKQKIQSVYTPDYYTPRALPSLNIHVGANYYFKNNIGINAELGVGIMIPYYSGLGVSYRI